MFATGTREFLRRALGAGTTKAASLQLVLLASLLMTKGAVVCAQAVANPAVRPFRLPLARKVEPHPAVVRVTAAEGRTTACGSGTLVGVFDRYGIVVTNWHVVRDAAGEVAVVFSDGFRSTARVLKVDPDWDLAALLIWRPHVDPVPIAVTPPRPGDWLTIAGYGSGSYQAAAGRCTQYVAPGMNLPYEMVEMSAAARQGDSGGPILNARGELAGVLFGSSGGTTSGSYCGRVRSFLQTAWRESAAADQLVASHVPPAGAAHARSAPLPQSASGRGGLPPATGSASSELTQGDHLEPPSGRRLSEQPTLAPPAERRPRAGGRFETTVHDHPAAARSPQGDRRPAWQEIVGDTPFEQAKTLMASVGALAVLLALGNLLAGHAQKE